MKKEKRYHENGIRANHILHENKCIAEDINGEKYYLTTQVAYELYSWYEKVYKICISNFIFTDTEKKKPYGNLDYFLYFYKESPEKFKLTEFGKEILTDIENGNIPGNNILQKMKAENNNSLFKYIA